MTKKIFIALLIKEHYENYFTYAYNKESYKKKKNSKKSSKHRILKIYKD